MKTNFAYLLLSMFVLGLMSCTQDKKEDIKKDLLSYYKDQCEVLDYAKRAKAVTDLMKLNKEKTDIEETKSVREELDNLMNENEKIADTLKRRMDFIKDKYAKYNDDFKAIDKELSSKTCEELNEIKLEENE